jgi:creatinine amidohydrolase
MTSSEIREAAKEDRVVMLPVGSIEQHGPHLPLGTDSFAVEIVCKKAAEKMQAEVVLAPTVAYGFNEESMDFPGTITINGTAFIEYLFSICRSFAHHGFKKIVIVNGHGNNIPYVNITSDRILYETKSICASVNYFSLASEKAGKILESSVLSHADEMETSMILAARPDLVDMSKAVKEISFPKSKWIFWGVNAMKKPRLIHFMDYDSRITRTGVVGDPTVATREKGEQMIEAFALDIADFVQEFRKRETRAREDHH